MLHGTVGWDVGVILGEIVGVLVRRRMLGVLVGALFGTPVGAPSTTPSDGDADGDSVGCTVVGEIGISAGDLVGDGFTPPSDGIAVGKLLILVGVDGAITAVDGLSVVMLIFSSTIASNCNITASSSISKPAANAFASCAE